MSSGPGQAPEAWSFESGDGSQYGIPGQGDFNVAVGGNFPGAPTVATEFPVSLEADYVRVYMGEP